jgi:hypothetical protein
MSRKLTIFLVLVWFLGPVWGEEVVLNPDHPDRHVVVKGDTLWDISGRFLSYPWQWPDIWEANPQIENPHLIYPGDVISLTYKDGRPILSLARGGRNVKLSPTIRESRRDDAIAPIPLDAIQQFLSRPRVVSEDQINQAAYVVSSQDQHLVTGTGNRIYVRGVGEPETSKFLVFRPGGAYLDPDTEDILGYEALHVGDIVLERLGDPATALIVKSNREILAGDRVMPSEEEEYPDFIPHAPAGMVDGNIISVLDGVSQIGQYQVIVVNRGASDGLEPGHVLAIYQAGPVVEDEIGSEVAYREQREAYLRAEEENPSVVGRLFESIANDLRATKYSIDKALGEPIGGLPVKVRLPEERAGEAMVFRTFDNVSYALVMNTQRPVHVLDVVRNPE